MITEEEAKKSIEKPHILHLKLIHTLRKGLDLSMIKRLVDEKKLSEKMKNCGQHGFNICQATYDDYKTIIEMAGV